MTLNVVLVHPQIPQNTGNIGRLCAATRSILHLIKPMAFEVTDAKVKRAGLDYWPYVDLTMHKDWEAYLEAAKPEKIWLLTKFASRLYYSAEFGANDAIVFGSETKGLGKSFIGRFPAEQCLKIPMPCSGVRSLNLSNAVSIVLYEARRQLRLDEI